MVDAMTHEEAIELLPWLANGTLADGQHGTVRSHAQSCVICRRELEELETFAHAVARADDGAGLPPPDMRRINARIDAALARERRGSALAVGFRRWAANPWRFAFAVQSLVVLAFAAAWMLPSAEEPAAYRTLSDPVQVGDGHYLRVVFDPALTEAGIDERLTAHGLALADGPSARGVYTLRFDDAFGAAERDTALAALRADDQVLFAQTVRAEQAP